METRATAYTKLKASTEKSPKNPVAVSHGCPGCKSHFRDRIHRRWWMRLIPNTKLFHCRNCNRQYMKWREPDILKARYGVNGKLN